MAEFVKIKISFRTAVVGCLSLVGLSASVVQAQSLPDPTRPPRYLGQSIAGSAEAVATGPVLQSVLLSPGRSIAIISGQTVKLGEQFGAAQLIKITESEVVLKNGSELQILKLFPNIGKRSISNRAQQDSVQQK